MRRKNAAHQQDIDDLKRQNEVLQTQSMGRFCIKTTVNVEDFYFVSSLPGESQDD
jgi:hypothetical protein